MLRSEGRTAVTQAARQFQSVSGGAQRSIAVNAETPKWTPLLSRSFSQRYRDIHLFVSTKDRYGHFVAGFVLVDLSGQFLRRIDRFSLEFQKNIAAHGQAPSSDAHLVGCSPQACAGC